LAEADHACNELDIPAKTNKGGSGHLPKTPGQKQRPAGNLG